MSIVTIQASKDAFVSSRFPTNNFGSDGWIYIGRYASYNETMRTLLGFDLSLIPNGSIVISATLHLYGNHQAEVMYPVPITFDAYRVTGAWTESAVTWDTQPTKESYPNVPGIISFYPSGFDSWDVTTLVSDMRHYGSDSMLLKVQNETESGSYRYCSKEAGALYAPYLEIEYAAGLFIAPIDGSISKAVTGLKIATAEGPIDKNVIGLQVFDGTGWKRVF